MAERIFRMLTISRDLKGSYPVNVSQIRFFNFTEGQFVLKLGEYSGKNSIGTIENCWIRITDKSNHYYDFVANEVYFDSNERGVFLLVSEETEFIDLPQIAKMVTDYLHESKNQDQNIDMFLDKYATAVYKEMQAASKQLAKLHSLVHINSFSRLDIEDAFSYSRAKLMRRYLLNLIASKLIKENREGVMELLTS